MLILSEITQRSYINTEKGMRPLMVKEILEGVETRNFTAPHRDRYVATIYSILGYELDQATINSLGNLYNLNESQFWYRVDNYIASQQLEEGVTIDGDLPQEEMEQAYRLIYELYSDFKRQMYDMFVENEFTDTPEAVEAYRVWFAEARPPLEQKSLELSPLGQYQEQVETSIMIYVIYMNNLVDVFGERMKELLHSFDGKYTLVEGVPHMEIISGDYVDRILYTINAREMYLIGEGLESLTVPANEDLMIDIENMIDLLSESMANGVRLLQISSFEDNAVEGYIIGELSGSITQQSKDGSIQHIFKEMRSNKQLAKDLIDRFDKTDQMVAEGTHFKTEVRVEIEKTLRVWWDLYSQAKSKSLPVVRKELLGFERQLKSDNIGAQIQSQTLINPYTYRVIIANTGLDPRDFSLICNNLLQNFGSSANFSADGGVGTNQFLTESNLIRILDINVFV